MPYFIMREWFRHTVGFSRNEVSRRYVDTPPEFFIPDRLRQRDPNLKQGSKPDPIPQDTQERERMQEYFIRSREYNNYLLSIGVCPEQARIVLPQAMYNEFIETASLYGYARLANLRLDSSAQKEIFYYAKIISEIIEPYFPVSWNALVKKTSETAHQDSHIDMPSL
jgi:thymidylate synthase (FAD)